MFVRFLALSAIMVFSRVLAQEPAAPPAIGYKDTYQLNVVTGLTPGVDSFVELASAGFHKVVVGDEGNICVNVYLFNPNETLCNCCAYAISGNSYTKLDLNALAKCPVPGGATASGGISRLMNGTVKLVATTPFGPNFSNCDPSQLQPATLLAGTGTTGVREYAGDAFATGLRAWATTPVFRSNFEKVPLSPLERDNLNTRCGNLQQSFPGSAGGTCKLSSQ